MVFCESRKKPGSAGLWNGETNSDSGGSDAMAAVHHFRFQLSLEGLDLTEHRETTGRAAHLALKQMEDLVQTLGSGPEGRVMLSGGSVQVHGGSIGFLDNMIMFAGDFG
jgi:hypothetical protein